MKFAYFLTAVRHVPLGYRFTLYSYGPFDSSVLQDVECAASVGALYSETVSYPTGRGYAIRPGSGRGELEELAKEFLNDHEADISWVISEFGKLNAADLELASTIVYIDDEAGSAISRDELARRVYEVKPHFSIERIRSWVETLKDKSLLEFCS